MKRAIIFIGLNVLITGVSFGQNKKKDFKRWSISTALSPYRHYQNIHQKPYTLRLETGYRIIRPLYAGLIVGHTLEWPKTTNYGIYVRYFPLTERMFYSSKVLNRIRLYIDGEHMMYREKYGDPQNSRNILIYKQRILSIGIGVQIRALDWVALMAQYNSNEFNKFRSGIVFSF